MKACSKPEIYWENIWIIIFIFRGWEEERLCHLANLFFFFSFQVAFLCCYWNKWEFWDLFDFEGLQRAARIIALLCTTFRERLSYSYLNRTASNLNYLNYLNYSTSIEQPAIISTSKRTFEEVSPVRNFHLRKKNLAIFIHITALWCFSSGALSGAAERRKKSFWDRV